MVNKTTTVCLKHNSYCKHHGNGEFGEFTLRPQDHHNQMLLVDSLTCCTSTGEYHGLHE